MRRAQLRVRQLVTVVAVAVFVAVTALTSITLPSSAPGLARTVAQQAPVIHPPFGRRWF